jgi:hypothetical protein
MSRVDRVSVSGFAYEESGSTVVLHCARRLQPMAELEYLREARDFEGGRIAAIKRATRGGRRLHIFTIERPGRAAVAVAFDVGSALPGLIGGLTAWLLLGGAVMAIGTLVYLILKIAGY